MTYGQFRVYLVLFVLVLGSWWLADLFEEKTIQVVKVESHSPDYFSHGYYKKEMTEHGLVKNELNADKMIHYSDDETTHLEQPVMTLYNSEAAPWVIQAEKAILKADKDNLLLIGQVLINRERSKKNKALNIKTSELRVKLSDNYAETDKWAEIVDVSNRTQGVGLQATFVEPIHLKFLSRVKGRYKVD